MHSKVCTHLCTNLSADSSWNFWQREAHCHIGIQNWPCKMYYAHHWHFRSVKFSSFSTPSSFLHMYVYTCAHTYTCIQHTLWFYKHVPPLSCFLYPTRRMILHTQSLNNQSPPHPHPRYVHQNNNYTMYFQQPHYAGTTPSNPTRSDQAKIIQGQAQCPWR